MNARRASKLLKAQLDKAQQRLCSEPLTWRTLEPVGFAAEPSIGGWQGLMTATVCARDHMYYESYTRFFSFNRRFIAELMHSGNYELVGKQRPYRRRRGRPRPFHSLLHAQGCTRVQPIHLDHDRLQRIRPCAGLARPPRILLQRLI